MIIVPTYNERSNIRPLVERIRKAAAHVSILFVDDNSPDGTQTEIAILQQTDQNIYLLARPRKLGLGSAYRQAFEHIRRSPEIGFVITLDADLSHDPIELPRFLELIKLYPVVIGSRYAAGGKIINWHPLRRLVSKFGNIYARFLTAMPVMDLTSGYVAYQTSWLNRAQLQNIQAEGYAFQIEMKYRLHALGAKIYEHPIAFVEREGGKSKFSPAIILEGMWFPFKIYLERLFRR